MPNQRAANFRRGLNVTGNNHPQIIWPPNVRSWAEQCRSYWYSTLVTYQSIFERLSCSKVQSLSTNYESCFQVQTYVCTNNNVPNNFIRRTNLNIECVLRFEPFSPQTWHITTPSSSTFIVAFSSNCEQTQQHCPFDTYANTHCLHAQQPRNHPHFVHRRRRHC